MANDGCFVVTGATGWVGRTVLEWLTWLLPPDQLQARVRAFSSRQGWLNFPGGISIPVQPLSMLPNVSSGERCAAFLHAAFLTPDHCAKLGDQLYAETNRSITQCVCDAVGSSPLARVVAFSSGAAALAESEDEACSAESRLYGYLKLDEERRLQALAPTLVLRIFALSGRHIRDPRRYALGDFIYQAIQGGPIVVNSNRRVVRGYVHADCLCELAIRWLLSNLSQPEQPLNAVTHEIDLVSLAGRIASAYGDCGVRVPGEFSSIPSVYSADPLRFFAFLSGLNVSISTIDQQIEDTALAFAPRVS